MEIHCEKLIHQRSVILSWMSWQNFHSSGSPENFFKKPKWGPTLSLVMIDWRINLSSIDWKTYRKKFQNILQETSSITSSFKEWILGERGRGIFIRHENKLSRKGCGPRSTLVIAVFLKNVIDRVSRIIELSYSSDNDSYHQESEGAD